MFWITIVVIVVIGSLSDRADAISNLRLPDWTIWCNRRDSDNYALPAHTCSPCVLPWHSVPASLRFFVPNGKAMSPALNIPSHIYAQIVGVSRTLSSPRMKELALSVAKSSRQLPRIIETITSNHWRLCHWISDKTAIEPGGFPSTTASPLKTITRRHSPSRPWISEDGSRESALLGTLGLFGA